MQKRLILYVVLACAVSSAAQAQFNRHNATPTFVTTDSQNNSAAPVANTKPIEEKRFISLHGARRSSGVQKPMPFIATKGRQPLVTAHRNRTPLASSGNASSNAPKDDYVNKNSNPRTIYRDTGITDNNASSSKILDVFAPEENR